MRSAIPSTPLSSCIKSEQRCQLGNIALRHLGLERLDGSFGSVEKRRLCTDEVFKGMAKCQRSWAESGSTMSTAAPTTAAAIICLMFMILSSDLLLNAAHGHRRHGRHGHRPRAASAASSRSVRRRPPLAWVVPPSTWNRARSAYWYRLHA